MRLAPLLAALLTASAAAAPLPPHDVDRIVDAIYIAEGGLKAKVPYGILSVRVRDAAHARQICRRTVVNNHTRWEAAGRPGAFVPFLGARYCPPAADPVGHRNWVRNVTRLLAR